MPTVPKVTLAQDSLPYQAARQGRRIAVESGSQLEERRNLELSAVMR